MACRIIYTVIHGVIDRHKSVVTSLRRICERVHVELVQFDVYRSTGFNLQSACTGFGVRRLLVTQGELLEILTNSPCTCTNYGERTLTFHGIHACILLVCPPQRCISVKALSPPPLVKHGLRAVCVCVFACSLHIYFSHVCRPRCTHAHTFTYT